MTDIEVPQRRPPRRLRLIAASPVAASQNRSVAQVATAVSPSIVTAEVSGSGQTDVGSGIVLSAGGLVLTNNHVIDGGRSVRIMLADGRTVAPINPADSGGALVNLAGQVVGINVAIATASDQDTGNIGVGFSVPADAAMTIIERNLDR